MLTSILLLIVAILGIIVYLLYEYKANVISGLEALYKFYKDYIASNSSAESETKLKKLSVHVYSKTSRFAYLELLQFAIFLYIMFRCNPFRVATKHPIVTNIITILVGFLYINLFFFLKKKASSSGAGDYTYSPGSGGVDSEQGYLLNILSTFFFFGLFIALPMGWYWLKQDDPLLTNFIDMLLKSSFILSLILAIITLTFLAGVFILCVKKNADPSTIQDISNKYWDKLTTNFKNFNNKQEKAGSVWSFFYKIITFIPCMGLALMDYLVNQYAITPRLYWLILAGEFGLLALWLFVPIIFNAVINKDGTHLLKEPIYLNEQKTLGTFENLHKNRKNDSKFTYRYALSAWFYINPQPPNTGLAYSKYTNILNYGNKPQVQYNSQKNRFRVMAMTGGRPGKGDDMVQVYATKNIPLQKWNHLAINYDGGNMDVFLNGELVGSRPNIAPYMKYENVSVGENAGIQGGICNVVYYNHILSKGTVSMIYRMLRDKHNPIL